MASAATLIQPQGELWERIRVELNENVKTREQDLAAIKEWLKKQPHLPDKWEDSCIMTFLRGCNFSLEKCKKKLDMYFTMRTACPEFFTDRDITNPVLQKLKLKAYGPTLPGLTPEGRRVTVVRVIDKNVYPDDLIQAFKVTMMIGDVRLMEEVEGIAGDIYVLDASAVTPANMAIISPAIIKKFLVCIQEAYPVKLKQIHVVNVSPLVDTLYSMLKPFVREKIKKRVFFHDDFSSLHKYVSKDMLPVEYGGTNMQFAEIHNAWMKKLEDYRDWFKKQEDLKAVEERRPGAPKNYDELFGIDGSFRQLSID